MFTFYIYKTTNQVNGKIYVGRRKTKTSVENDKKYLGSGIKLKAAIKKYGIQNFSKEVLFIFDNPTEMFLKEAELVNLEFVQRKDTYNLVVGGTGGTLGLKYSEEAKSQRSENTKGRKMSAQAKKNMSIAQQGKNTGKNNGMYGKTHSEETRKKISLKNIGRKMTEEQLQQAIINNAGENNGMYGKTHSEETRKKMSLKSKERIKPSRCIQVTIDNITYESKKAALISLNTTWSKLHKLISKV